MQAVWNAAFQRSQLLLAVRSEVVADLDPDAEVDEDSRYESCKIDYIDRGLGGAWYECRSESNVIARSPKRERFSDQHPMFLDLVSKLLSEGWEPVTSDEEGNPVTLRRRKK